MSFIYRKQLSNTGRVFHKTIITNSATMDVGDAIVYDSNGFVTRAGSDAAVAGIVVAILDKDGLSISPQEGTLRGSSDATVASGVVTVASDNQTDATNGQVTAVYDISLDSVYGATVTGTIDATNSSREAGAWIDSDDHDSLEETTATRTIATGGVYQTVPSSVPTDGAIDEVDSSRLLVHISQSQIYADASPA